MMWSPRTESMQDVLVCLLILLLWGVSIKAANFYICLTFGFAGALAFYLYVDHVRGKEKLGDELVRLHKIVRELYVPLMASRRDDLLLMKYREDILKWISFHAFFSAAEIHPANCASALCDLEAGGIWENVMTVFYPDRNNTLEGRMRHWLEMQQLIELERKAGCK